MEPGGSAKKAYHCTRPSPTSEPKNTAATETKADQDQNKAVEGKEETPSEEQSEKKEGDQPTTAGAAEPANRPVSLLRARNETKRNKPKAHCNIEPNPTQPNPTQRNATQPGASSNPVYQSAIQLSSMGLEALDKQLGTTDDDYPCFRLAERLESKMIKEHCFRLKFARADRFDSTRAPHTFSRRKILLLEVMQLCPKQAYGTLQALWGTPVPSLYSSREREEFVTSCTILIIVCQDFYY